MHCRLMSSLSSTTNASLAKFSSSHALPFLTQSLHNQAVSLYTSQDTCLCFHCLCISFLSFSLTSRSQLIRSSLLPSFLDFLNLGIAIFCTLCSSLRPRGQACTGYLPGCCLILPSSCHVHGVGEFSSCSLQHQGDS